MFSRKEEWVINEDDYAAEVIVDRNNEAGLIIKINQDDDAVWLSVEGARQLVGAIAEALVAIENPAPHQR